MHRATRRRPRLLDRAEQSPDQDIQALRVSADAREKGPVADAAEPEVHLEEIEVAAEETGHHDDRRPVTARDAAPVQNG
jgi:hypothetical protein